jgi:hypothetical protein
MMRKYKLPTGETFYTDRTALIECNKFLIYSSRFLQSVSRRRRAAYSQFIGQRDIGCVVKVTYHVKGILWRTTYFYSPIILDDTKFDQLCHVID